MAKNFPFFKFFSSKWMTGNIVFEPFNIQGFFINVCALYWERDGQITVDDINRRYKNPIELSECLGHYFEVDETGKICIKFLDEQFDEINEISKTNSKNGSLGGRPKKSEENRPLTVGLISQSEPKAKESKEELELEEDKEEEKKEIKNQVESIPEKQNPSIRELTEYFTDTWNGMQFKKKIPLRVSVIGEFFMEDRKLMKPQWDLIRLSELLDRAEKSHYLKNDGSGLFVLKNSDRVMMGDFDNRTKQEEKDPF